MKKVSLKSMGLLFKGMALFAGCALMLSSCSKDDDDNNGGGGSNVTGNSTSLVQEGKMLLTSVEDEYGTVFFTYDEKLRPVHVYEAYKYEGGGYDRFFIDYKTGKITAEKDEGLATFNDKGYITKIRQFGIIFLKKV